MTERRDYDTRIAVIETRMGTIEHEMHRFRETIDAVKKEIGSINTHITSLAIKMSFILGGIVILSNYVAEVLFR